jgi:hypothetical protein
LLLRVFGFEFLAESTKKKKSKHEKKYIEMFLTYISLPDDDDDDFLDDFLDGFLDGFLASKLIVGFFF